MHRQMVAVQKHVGGVGGVQPFLPQFVPPGKGAGGADAGDNTDLTGPRPGIWKCPHRRPLPSRRCSNSPGPPPPSAPAPRRLTSGFAGSRPRLPRPCQPSRQHRRSHPPPKRPCPPGTPSTHHLTPPRSSPARRPGRPCAPSVPGQSASGAGGGQPGHVVGFCPGTHWAPANQRRLRRAGRGGGGRGHAPSDGRCTGFLKTTCCGAATAQLSGASRRRGPALNLGLTSDQRCTEVRPGRRRRWRWCGDGLGGARMRGCGAWTWLEVQIGCWHRCASQALLHDQSARKMTHDTVLLLNSDLGSQWGPELTCVATAAHPQAPQRSCDPACHTDLRHYLLPLH